MSNVVADTITQWKGKQHNETPPFRYEFEDIDEDVQFLLSYDPLNGHKIRCAGLFFEGLIGSSIVGRTLPSLFEAEYQKRIEASIERVFSGPAVVKLQIQTEREPIDMVLLPIRAEHGPVEHAFGAINLTEMPKFATPKIGLVSLNIDELRNESTGTAVGFAEGKTAFTRKNAPTFIVIDGSPLAKGFVKKTNLKIIKDFKREP